MSFERKTMPLEEMSKSLEDPWEVARGDSRPVPRSALIHLDGETT